MNKYRFILGKSVDDSVNLVTNGDFGSGLTGWTTYGTTRWHSVSGAAECYSGGALSSLNQNLLRQTGIVSPGESYYLAYKLKKATSGSAAVTNGKVTYSIGGRYFAYQEVFDVNSTTSFINKVHENLFCGFGNDLTFYCDSISNNCAIDDVQLYPYVWNQPLADEPIDWLKTKITKKRDPVLNGLIVQYISNIVFIGDGYDYLYNKYLTDGFCAEVPVRIDVLNSSTEIYEPFFEGMIYLNDCKFNVTKKQVSVNIEDGNSSQVFLRNKDVKINVLNDSATQVGLIESAPSADMDIAITDDSGTPDGGGHIATLIYSALRRIIMRATNYRMDADSSFFSSDTFQYFCIIIGSQLNASGASSSEPQFKLSISELYKELNNLFNLTFSIDNSGAIPKLFIEPKVDYLNSTPVLTLSLINNLEFVFDKENMVRAVQIGYKIIDESPTDTFLNNLNGLQYILNGQCADKTLNLVSEWVQRSNIIKRMAGISPAITSTKYDQVWHWLETDGVNSVNTGSGSHGLNPNIETEANMARQVATLQASFINQNDGIPLTTVTKSNPILDKIYSFKYPISKAQFDLIEQAYNTVQFDTDGSVNTTKTGYILEANFEIETGLTDFKLLSN